MSLEITFEIIITTYYIYIHHLQKFTTFFIILLLIFHDINIYHKIYPLKHTVKYNYY